MNPSPALVAAAAIVDDLERPRALLAARRSAPKSLTGRWEFPGGKVEEGESDEAALHREIREELGVDVRLGEQIHGPDGEDWPILYGHRMRVWLAQIEAGIPEPLADHDDLRWLTHSDLHEVPWLEPDLPIVTAIHQILVPRS